MADDPIKTLTDTLTLLRVEIADVKRAQITEDRLKYLEAALEDTGAQIEGVRKAAALGGQEGAQSWKYAMEETSRDIFKIVETATRSLSKAQEVASERLSTLKRLLWTLVPISAVLGLILGAFMSLLISDYGLKREFEDTLDLMGWTFTCKNQGGFIAEQENGTFCVFKIE